MSKSGLKNTFKFAFLFWLLLIVFLIISSLPDNNLHLVFCDVGQGDAILITHKYNQILIDGGLDKNKGSLLKCLKKRVPFWDREIELLINTHPDEDHFGGLVEIISRFKIRQYLHNGINNVNSLKFQEFREILSDKNICSKRILINDRFCMSGICFDVVNSGVLDKNEEINTDKCQLLNLVNSNQDLNNGSIVLLLNFDDFDAFLTGDISADIEKLLAWRNKLKKVEVLKIAHHGSKTSTSPEILETTEPKLAIISVGENSFGHPADEVLERLKSYQIKTLRTDRNGIVEVITDGEKWWIEKEK